tara:strand:+ start:232 stop:543 length:312 start_codon:yes stop_codon:yes gene_type:complete
MIIDHRTYTVAHGMNKEYLDLFEAEGLPVQLRHLNLVGYFTTAIGPINQFIHLWSYDDLADMERRRMARDADPEWHAYRKKSKGMLVHQENKIISPVSFSPLK